MAIVPAVDFLPAKLDAVAAGLVTVAQVAHPVVDLVSPATVGAVVLEGVSVVEFPQARFSAAAEMVFETAAQVAQLTCLAVVSPGTLVREAPVLAVSVAVTGGTRVVNEAVCGARVANEVEQLLGR